MSEQPGMTNTVRQLAENLACVQQQIADAAQRSGRSPADIRLVAVTKYVDSQIARCLYQAGCHDLAESRPQELWAKTDALADLEVRWHLIGHLQRNKIARTLPGTWLLQSVDSLRLLQAIQSWAETHRTQRSLLLEVNTSGDTAKHGFAPDQVQQAVREAARSPWTPVDGLMCMASLSGGLEQARVDFARLRQLRDNCHEQWLEGPPLRELSMGMSADFPVAIEEGATIIRVGSALFEGVVD